MCSQKLTGSMLGLYHTRSKLKLVNELNDNTDDLKKSWESWNQSDPAGMLRGSYGDLDHLEMVRCVGNSPIARCVMSLYWNLEMAQCHRDMGKKLWGSCCNGICSLQVTREQLVQRQQFQCGTAAGLRTVSRHLSAVCVSWHPRCWLANRPWLTDLPTICLVEMTTTLSH